ncbi:SDR family oxidoreductase [Bordetella genomosp. 5]|uniref:Gluconate 5-dehydrogenase n=1 Tax=Bordetella genomosp. 5 TaxID=1395608 RepID=A0A261U0X5_9BORD|nr:SDR family oxidoreductase [Bordetella genomosp. 5]OZI55072.1 gluconate 5-dehydrogenase [Bordetella genomosp. 5]
MPAAATDSSFLQQFSLAGRVALVTGSARGLGWCIAQALAESGAHVLINGRNGAAVEAAVAALRERGLAAGPAVFDVANDDAVEAAFAAIDRDHGRLDILVNNVGARNRKSLADASPAEVRELIETDLVAGILIARQAAARMTRHGYGRLIAITSVVGELARRGDAIYPAAKQGLTGIMRALALEHGAQGITSNAIAPGTFATETNAAMVADPNIGPVVAARNPTGRWGRPEEIAGAAVFLASPAASYVNGHVLVVDGGLSVQF